MRLQPLTHILGRNASDSSTSSSLLALFFGSDSSSRQQQASRTQRLELEREMNERDTNLHTILLLLLTFISSHSWDMIDWFNLSSRFKWKKSSAEEKKNDMERDSSERDSRKCNKNPPDLTGLESSSTKREKVVLENQDLIDSEREKKLFFS